MATESPIRIFEVDESQNWPSTVDSAMFASSLGKIGGHESLGKQPSTVPNRSGSAPPTFEGSIASLQTFINQWNSSLETSESRFSNYESEEQMRTDPAYIAYYYAHVNLNPRLPPPLISRENLHLVRLMRDSGNKKLTSVTEVSLATHREDSEDDTFPPQTSRDAMEDLLQVSSSTALEGESSHDIHTSSTTEQSYKMQESCSTLVNEHDHANAINSHSIASASNADSPSSSTRFKIAEQVDNYSTKSDFGSDISVLESRIESLNMSGSLVTEENQRTLGNTNSNYENNLTCLPSQNAANQVHGFQGNAIPPGVHVLHGRMEKLSNIHPNPLGLQTFMHNFGAVAPVPSLYTSTAAYMNSGNLFYPVLRPPGFFNPQFAPPNSSVFQPPYFGGYPQTVDPYSTVGMFKQAEGSMGPMNPYASQMLYLSKNYPTHEMMIRGSFSPSKGQYYQPPFDDARRTASQHGQIDVHTLPKGSDVTALIGEKELGHPLTGGHLRVNYYQKPPSLVVPHFPSPPTVLVSPMAGSNHARLTSNVNVSQHSPTNSVSYTDSKGQKGLDGSDNPKRHSFLELVKSCNSRKLELSDILGKIVEFSTDQHGSRFIQQKLEHCSIEEKESVFNEVIPYASKLMIDVFGNYVIQKFFEHGNAEQRRRLGEQLNGKILLLSLQMYGCRVIQKALEVIELDQKTKLIQELDGNVMRCVHDQNGNHVIQKCIESVPTDRVRFIISCFQGQVAALSCHPYGCRVIQRVLEHCSDEQICKWIIEEIMESTCNLAPDPYGNYVTQHVLGTGKPQERSEIIRRLMGKFIQMSQHKYASNVVEKCLKYGDASERDLIIEEFVAQPDNGDALLKMMKDQFGNYVVQKIFDMGSDQQKDILLKCIQTHLLALKKFPYAKHIVAHYEQLSEGSAVEQKQ